MMGARSGVIVLLAAGVAVLAPQGACAPTPTLHVPADLLATLNEAERLVQQGCYQCLTEAMGLYEELLAVDGAAPRIRDGAFRAALLVGTRERELGLTGGVGLERAASLLATTAVLERARLYLDVAELVRWQPVGLKKDVLDQYSAHRMAVRPSQERWNESLRPLVHEDALAAYLYISLNCSAMADQPPETLAALRQHQDALFVRFRLALCDITDAQPLAPLLQEEPRFTEVYFFQAQRALRALDSAEAHRLYLKAHDTQTGWPAPPLALADLYFAFEETARSLEYYERALALVPEQRDALLGKAKNLSHLAQHEQALEVLDVLVELGQWHLGDVYYWRAWNYFNLQQLERAVEDVEAAKKYRGDSEVFKLAGLIALEQRRLRVARRELETAVARNAEDCDAAFYLGRVHILEERWPETGHTFAGAVPCYEAAEERLRVEIAQLRADDTVPGDRRTRLLAKRASERQRARRQRSASSHNAALGYFNAQLWNEAQSHAEEAATHVDFAERAETLLVRIRELH